MFFSVPCFKLLQGDLDCVAQIVEREQRPYGEEIMKASRFAMLVDFTTNYME